MRFSRLLAVALVLLLIVPALPSEAAGSGYVITFPRPGTNDTLTAYNDTVFVGLVPANNAIFDEKGDVWYATYGGVVHDFVGQGKREVFTRMEGLPESVALDLSIGHGKVYVATDLGLAIIDEVTGQVTNKTPFNSPLGTPTVNAVLAVDDQVWMGTGCSFEGCINKGITVWNTTSDTWFEKNTSTSAFRPTAVVHMNRFAHSIWSATDGDGGWKFDLTNGNLSDPGAWSKVYRGDGLFNDHLLSVAEFGDEIFFGTHYGLARYTPALKGTGHEWRKYNSSQDGMPDNQVDQLHVVPTTDGKAALIADTKQGVWEFDPVTGLNETLAQNFGIYGAYVANDHWDPQFGWLFSTQKGVSLLRDGVWTYFTTGPSKASNGPSHYRFTTVGVGESGSFLWFGRSDGITAYSLPKPGHPGKFFNFGSLDRIPGGLVNWIDSDGPMTWFATTDGAWGFDAINNSWRATPVRAGLTYGIAADHNQLWIPTFGDGLVMVDQTTKVTRTWNATTAPTFPDYRLTDARTTVSDVWLGAGSGVIRLDRTTGAVLHSYTRADGLPGDGVVYRVLPDGAAVYVGMRNGGVAKLDVGSGHVTQVWNATTIPGFPTAQIDTMLREGHSLWVGTHAGLVRIDLTTGAARTFDVTTGLVQDYVTGLGLADGILYLSTYSGIARFDTATQTFLPMQDGAGVVRVGADATGTSHGSISAAGALSARFDAPRDGSAVAGVVLIRGTSLKFGGAIDRVEVKIGDGAWTPAQGTDSWTYSWDTTTGPLNSPVPLYARAIAGNDTSPEAEILLTPVAPSTIPLSLAPTMPPSWTAQRDLPITLKATGDEPLSARIYYKPEGASTYTPLELARQGAFFTGTLGAREVIQGNLTYYFEIRSGPLALTSPEDTDQPIIMQIDAAPSLGVALTGPSNVIAVAGVSTQLPLTLVNTGTEPVTVRLVASGLRSTWARVPGASAITLPGGASRTLNVNLTVPEAAFADNTTLRFEAQDVDGIATPAAVTVPIQVQAAHAKSTATPGDSKPVPGFAMYVAVAAVALALIVRRRSS